VDDASSRPAAAAADSAGAAAAGTEAPATSTFSFTRGLALVPPAAR
jgi:hypothetical protein